MNNYPPGVTGFEPQIAGYPEIPMSAEVECPAGGTHSYSDGDYDWDCGFGGLVKGSAINYDGEVIFYWECPECGKDNETAIDL